MNTNGDPETGRTRDRHVILQVEGIVVHASQTPDDIQLILVDEEVYTEPMLGYTREDLAPYETCAACGFVRKEHAGGVGPNLWRDEECEHFEPTGKTPVGDSLYEWEER